MSTVGDALVDNIDRQMQHVVALSRGGSVELDAVKLIKWLQIVRANVVHLDQQLEEKSQ